MLLLDSGLSEGLVHVLHELLAEIRVHRALQPAVVQLVLHDLVDVPFSLSRVDVCIQGAGLVNVSSVALGF